MPTHNSPGQGLSLHSSQPPYLKDCDPHSCSPRPNCPSLHPQTPGQDRVPPLPSTGWDPSPLQDRVVTPHLQPLGRALFPLRPLTWEGGWYMQDLGHPLVCRCSSTTWRTGSQIACSTGRGFPGARGRWSPQSAGDCGGGEEGHPPLQLSPYQHPPFPGPGCSRGPTPSLAVERGAQGGRSLEQRNQTLWPACTSVQPLDRLQLFPQPRLHRPPGLGGPRADRPHPSCTPPSAQARS